MLFPTYVYCGNEASRNVALKCGFFPKWEAYKETVNSGYGRETFASGVSYNESRLKNVQYLFKYFTDSFSIRHGYCVKYTQN